jgi:hypothetical protein
MTVTLQVSARYAHRFRQEAVQVLGSAAASIKDTTDHLEAAKDRHEQARRDLDVTDLAILDAAKSVFVQAREQQGDLTISAPAYTLREVVAGCASDAAEQLFHSLDSFDFQPEELLNEIEHWQGKVEFLSDRMEEDDAS